MIGRVVVKPVLSDVDGWRRGWHGGLRKQSPSIEWLHKLVKDREAKAHAKGLIGERELEVQAFVYLLTQIRSNPLRILELGAAWGEWCLAAASWVRHTSSERKVYCVAVEALESNYQLCLEHFVKNKLHGEVVRGAVSDRDGKAKFTLPLNDSYPYGNGCESGRPFPSRIVYRLLGKRVDVPCYSLKSLLTRYGHFDIVHMDIQGMEADVIKAALPVKDIDYLMIGTHSRRVHNEVRELLTPDYSLLVDCDPRMVQEVEYMMVDFQDGMIVAKRKQ